jgi:hypothetical protein
MSLLKCPRCLIPLTVGYCSSCDVSSIFDEAAEPLTQQELNERRRAHESYRRLLEHRDRQKLGNELSRRRTDLVGYSREALYREAEDKINWLNFHLQRAGYPASILAMASRLSATIKLYQSVEDHKHRKGNAI